METIKRMLGWLHLTDQEVALLKDDFPSVLIGGGPEKSWKQQMREQEEAEGWKRVR